MKKTLVFIFALAWVTGAMAQNSVSITEGASAIRYNHMIFGHFIEHFHRQIYGGIFDPGNSRSDEDGFRTDVIDALREIKTPIVRWPGGCFVSTYHWLDGVGPQRTPSYDKAWQVEDPNTFGTDEYIKWCRKVGCEPYICTNAGTGTPEEMSDWVEYCNLSVGKWGRMRMANGYTDPYNVKYWSVGNENYGSWELGARTVQEWGPLVRESAKLMRSVTKDAKLFAAATSNSDWTLPLLREAGWTLDYISLHGYWDPLYHVNTPASFIDCMMKTDAPERDIVRAIEILDEAGLGGGKMKIAYDEWNLRNWHHPWHGDLRRGFDIAARDKNDINSTYTMADALFSACFLNSCLRHSDIVDIACFSPIVNARGALYVHPEGIVKRSTFYVFYMYSNLLQNIFIPTSATISPLRHNDRETSVLDVVLTANDDRTQYTYAIVNKHPDESVTVSLDFAGTSPRSVTATLLSGESVDDYNDIGRESVKPKECTLKVQGGKVCIPAHTLAFLNFSK